MPLSKGKIAMLLMTLKFVDCLRKWKRWKKSHGREIIEFFIRDNEFINDKKICTYLYVILTIHTFKESEN